MPEKDYFKDIISIFVIVLVIQSILFSFFRKIGIFFIVGLIFYFLFFMNRDKKMKKEELDQLLTHEKSWRGYDRKLSKEIP
jgi:predicted membrane protein